MPPRRAPRSAPPVADGAWARGSVLLSTAVYLREARGDETFERVLALMTAEQRERCLRADPTADVPYALVRAMWQAADRVVSPLDPEWMERAGAFSIESTGMQLYGGILRKSTPIEFLTQSVSLFRLYYHPGDMEVVYQEPGGAVLRLVGFDPATTLFCQRQTGGLRCAITLAGGLDAHTRHVRCSVEGDAFCEWELGWRLG